MRCFIDTTIKRFYLIFRNVPFLLVGLDQDMASDEVLRKNNITVPGQPGATYREGGVIFKLASKLSPEVRTF
jgi:hypothetical protein